MGLSRVLLLSLVLLLCVTYATNAACKKHEDEENNAIEEFDGLMGQKDSHVKGHGKSGKKKKGDDDDDDEKKSKKKGGKKKGDDDDDDKSWKKKGGKKKGDDDDDDKKWKKKGGKKKGDDDDKKWKKKGGKKGGDDDDDKKWKKKGGKKGGDDDDDDDKEWKKKGGKKGGDDDDDDKEWKKKGGKKGGDDDKEWKKKGGKKGGDDDKEWKKGGKKGGDDDKEWKKGGKKGGKGKGGDDKGPIGGPVDGPGPDPTEPPVDEPIKGGTKGGTNFDVTKFGAKGDGSTLDSEAFLKAWEQACSSKATFPVLVIPKGNYVLKATEFLGPCNSKSIGVQLWGTIISSPRKSDWSKCEDFISFRNVDNLEVSGSGGIDGNGPKWWDNTLSCGKRPTSLALNSCKGVHLSGIHSKNSARNHMSVSSTSNAVITGISLTAPDESPNTDGIDISSSSSITVQNSFIGSGDDCVAINKNTKDVNIKNIKCGPGHGISVGSLGRGGELAQVENIFVSQCTFDKTDNGARIKTWKGGRGYVRNVIYRDITLIDVRRPIIIDQNYVDKHHKLENEDSSLSISNVKFINFKGTCRESDAITLKCSTSGSGCTGVELQNVNIQGSSGTKAQATCENANVRTMQSFPPVSCGHGAGKLSYSDSDYQAWNVTN